ncbi:hypothetical protein EVAR_36503_1 [Eumeta japonica]|uniref:Uncharacterized protein n=1 Tax=Eumeta variegata TaxID=151549 RepID=A0A4C1SEC0_EUMVA|nr:hypothetical protein EVAR_36503_1 [Eumeta japonica]
MFSRPYKATTSDNLTGVLNYLQNPRKDEENQLLSELEWHNLFPVLTQALLRKQIKSIVKRLNSRDDTEEEERSESLTDVELRPETSQPQLTLKEKLQLEIDKSMKSPDPEIQIQNESGMTNSIRREMSLFENGGVRGYYLETAYKAAGEGYLQIYNTFVGQMMTSSLDCSLVVTKQRREFESTAFLAERFLTRVQIGTSIILILLNCKETELRSASEEYDMRHVVIKLSMIEEIEKWKELRTLQSLYSIDMSGVFLKNRCRDNDMKDRFDMKMDYYYSTRIL